MIGVGVGAILGLRFFLFSYPHFHLHSSPLSFSHWTASLRPARPRYSLPPLSSSSNPFSTLRCPVRCPTRPYYLSSTWRR
ncbi:hypothetical protein F5X98DRAFT_340602 [Xylaria grammica]|nr:hypothetical protein F5X98DRAFT_340602 [Xylaria grammica]